MASQQTVNYAGFVANPQLHVPAQQWGGRVKRYHFSHTLTSAMAVAETLTLFVIPPKCRVVGGVMGHDGLVAAGSFDAGTAAVPTKYANARVLTGGASSGSTTWADVPTNPAAATLGGAFGVETAGSEVIILTARGGTWASGKVISGYLDVQIGD